MSLKTVVKIGKKISTHPSANVSAYAPCARSVSLTRKKKHGCPEWAFITNGHASSCRQSRKTTEWRHACKWGQAEKDIKRTNVGQWGMSYFSLCFVTVFCFGQELIRREMEFSLEIGRRELLNTERKSLVVVTTIFFFFFAQKHLPFSTCSEY